jgi:hypothetical protein
MDKRGYPEGDPQGDLEKLGAWWAEETARCGLPGPAAIDYSPFPGALAQAGLDRRLLEALAMDRDEVPAHVYLADLPGLPWPLTAVAATAQDGMLLKVLYQARLRCSVPGAVRFTLVQGWFAGKRGVLGPGAGWFNQRAELAQACREALRIRHEAPLRGYHAAAKAMGLKQAYVELLPEAQGLAVTICTTVRHEGGASGTGYSLGLDQALAVFRALERA